jgi:hypothetical protein
MIFTVDPSNGPLQLSDHPSASSPLQLAASECLSRRFPLASATGAVFGLIAFYMEVKDRSPQWSGAMDKWPVNTCNISGQCEIDPCGALRCVLVLRCVEGRCVALRCRGTRWCHGWPWLMFALWLACRFRF